MLLKNSLQFTLIGVVSMWILQCYQCSSVEQCPTDNDGPSCSNHLSNMTETSSPGNCDSSGSPLTSSPGECDSSGLSVTSSPGECDSSGLSLTSSPGECDSSGLSVTSSPGECVSSGSFQTSSPGECGSSGSPLILTPYLESGRIQEAIEASRVDLIQNVTSYSGFFTVNKTHNSNMFFWFFPATDGNTCSPVVLWLQGGPGSSSMYGLFVENGPFSLDEKLNLIPRKCSWTTSHSVLYIDNPVGSGFSFTDEEGYSTNEEQVGQNLYNALVQFFTLFDSYKNNDFFVTGESYAGKFIPAVCYVIHNNNLKAEVKINLKGMAIGNGYSDPVSMMNYGDYLYQIGLIDNNGKEVFKQMEQQIVEFINLRQWMNAYDLFNTLILGTRIDSTIFQNLTGFSSYYNYLLTDDPTLDDSNYVEQFLSKPSVLKSLHVGERSTPFKIATEKPSVSLMEDNPQSVKPWVEVLLENYRVMFYNGQLDIIEAYPLTESFLNSLCWSGSNAFQNATRTKWYVGSELAGYSKVGGNLTFLLVRNSGHLVPTDQPKWALDMICRFTRNESF